MQIFKNIVDRVKERIEIRRKEKRRQRFYDWREETICYRSNTIKGMFHNFKYIVEVDHRLFFEDERSDWKPCDAAKHMFYPMRDTDTCCFWKWEQVTENRFGGWDIDMCFGTDKVFVATNDECDMIELSLKYGI